MGFMGVLRGAVQAVNSVVAPVAAIVEPVVSTVGPALPVVAAVALLVPKATTLMIAAGVAISVVQIHEGLCKVEDALKKAA